jgi:hypothetical protein
MSLWDVNWLGVVIAVVVNIVLGSIWYSPYLFGKAWAEALKLDMKTLVGTPLLYAAATGVSLITAYVLAVLIKKFGISTYDAAFTLAFWIWLGFIATSHFSGVLWAKRPLKSYMIDTAFSLISLLVMAFILTTFKW